MNREQMEHVIRAAGAVLEEDTIYVIGSQAVLACFSEHALPEAAVRSIELDLLPVHDPDETKADKIDGAIGELSLFHETHGIYGDGVSERTAVFPSGWRDRCVPVANVNTGGVTALCAEPHDLCVSKLVAGRQKDYEFVRALLASGHVDAATLHERLNQTDVADDRRHALRQFVDANA